MAFTDDEIATELTRTAMRVLRADGAFVEHLVAGESGGPDAVVVRASSGEGMPPIGATAPLTGSYAALVLDRGEPLLMDDASRAACSSPLAGGGPQPRPGIVIPLGHRTGPVGALVVCNGREHPVQADLHRARILDRVAALAYEKVRLLDEAREGRDRLARVIESRSRLIRGFSHDVKNPLGAADGYA
jgi:signal transduction histidine kinase